MLNIFTDNWVNPPVLNDGERMLRILTGNPVNELYVIVDDSMDDDEVNDEIRFALRHKCGKHMEYGGFEDVSYICVQAKEVNETADECWEGEGYYRIAWSDGGMDWTNNGPVWFEYKDGLAAELEAAYQFKTDTHLPYAELVGTELFQECDLDAMLGDFKDDFDIDGLIDDLTEFDYRTGNRYWKNIGDDKLNEILAKHDNSR